MARKRMISPEIWESSSFSKLTDFAKLIFIGLISNADDEGKGKANPGYIRSKLFPNDEERRVTDIKKALSDIALTMSITFYEVNGDSLYLLTNWARWQKIDRPTPSKFPNPPQEQSAGERGSYTQNQDFDESSTNTRRGLDESSPLIEKKGIEEKRIESKNNNKTQIRACARETLVLSASDAYPQDLCDKERAMVEWDTVLSKLECDMNSLSFDVWIKPLESIGYSDDNLVLVAPTEAHRDEVTRRYLPIINTCATEIKQGANS